MHDDDPKWIEMCTRHPAWNRAKVSWIENGMAEDKKWQRCLKAGDMSAMDDDCWTALIAANPQGE